jgi:predicted restriction endonuclease
MPRPVGARTSRPSSCSANPNQASSSTGLCVPDHFEVRAYQADNGTQVPNYQFHFSILNTNAVPVTWLHERAQQNGDSAAPDVWQHWVQTREVAQWPTGETLDQSGRIRRYETSETVVSDVFREETFDRYDHACTMTGIREDDLLDLAHILPRSQHPDLAEHPENVIVLNSLHHRAFDAALFTIDSDYRIRASPSFDPAHPFLRETILSREGEQLAFPSGAQVQPSFREELNTNLSWL